MGSSTDSSYRISQSSVAQQILDWAGTPCSTISYKRLLDPIAKAQIVRRINRLELGKLGDHRFCRDDMWELRVDRDPGYRLYYAQAGERIVLLLLRGDKRTQDADIDRAVLVPTENQATCLAFAD